MSTLTSKIPVNMITTTYFFIDTKNLLYLRIVREEIQKYIEDGSCFIYCWFILGFADLHASKVIAIAVHGHNLLTGRLSWLL